MSEAINPAKRYARRRKILAAWLLCSSLVLGFVFTDARIILPAEAPAPKALAGLVEPSPIAATEAFFAIPLRNARRLAREIAAIAPPAPRPFGNTEPQVPGAAAAPAALGVPQPGDTVGLADALTPPPTLTPIPTFITPPPGVFSEAPPPPEVIPTEPEPGIPGVPEPSTWAMLILGFMGVGVALRRNRRRDKAVAPANS